MRGGIGLPEGRHDIFEAEFFLHLSEYVLVACRIGVAAFHIGIRLESEAEFGILLIPDADVDIFHERAHHRDRLFRSPELLAEVEVHRDDDAVALCRLAGESGEQGRLVRNRRSDPRPMEPGCAFHDGIEIEVLRLGLGDRRMGTVVDYF